MAQLRPHLDTIRELGAEVTVIGSGTRNFVQGFRDRTRFYERVLVDPELRSFQAAGLKRSVAATLNPKVLLRSIKAVASGHTQQRTKGDRWQQGGTVVIRPDGGVAFHFISASPGHYAAPEAIIAALKDKP